MDKRAKLTDVPIPPRPWSPPEPRKPEQQHQAEHPHLSDEARAELARIVAQGKVTDQGLALPQTWSELGGCGLVHVRQIGNALEAEATPLGLRSCALALQYGFLRDLVVPPLDTLYDTLDVPGPGFAGTPRDVGTYLPQHLPPGRIAGS